MSGNVQHSAVAQAHTVGGGVTIGVSPRRP
ncbi:hypothetical protein QFZ24_007194 [Streptomyces phaeochromogenes]|jgi:hypothetical protein|nr:hypothetical protein [Streptomyces phaeochromogenes]